MSEEVLQTVELHRYLDGWQVGDPDAANRLFEAIGRRLENLARRMLRGYPNVREFVDTNDVYQGTVIRLMTTLSKLRPATTRDFFNIAAAHVRRELLDLARKYARKPRPGCGPRFEEDSDLAPAAPDSSPVDDLELWGRFHEAVGRLPGEERDVFSLYFYHGWTQPDIAELLGINERTVRRRWRDATRLLAQMCGRLPNP
jgi:RNA polymerase sigma-70 factor (ECF subfamily)